MNETMTYVMQLVGSICGLALIAAIKVVMNYLDAKKSELKNKVQSDKINAITSMVDDNIRQEVEAGMIRIKNSWNAGLFNKESGGPGSFNESLGKIKLDINKTIKGITSSTVVTYLTKEHIEDFDKWVTARVEFYVTQQLDQLLPTKDKLNLKE